MGAINISDEILEKFTLKCKDIGLTNKQVGEFLVKKFLLGDLKYEIEYKE